MINLENVAISYLLDIAPALAIAGTVIFYLYKMYIFERKQNIENYDRLDKSKKEMEEVLKKLTEYINKVYENAKYNQISNSTSLNQHNAEIKAIIEHEMTEVKHKIDLIGRE